MCGIYKEIAVIAQSPECVVFYKEITVIALSPECGKHHTFWRQSNNNYFFLKYHIFRRQK
jgi:hypothetical protein